MTEIVTLSESEMLVAAQVGLFRRMSAIKKGRPGKYGIDNAAAGLFDADIVACQCELAVGKFLNLHWPVAIGITTLADVGGMVEVRSILDPTRRLIVHAEDKDEAPFVLVHSDGGGRLFNLLGWCFGREAKTPANKVRAEKCLRNGGYGSFVVQQEDLNQDFDALKQFCADTLVAPQKREKVA